MNSQTSHPHRTFPQLRHGHGACRGVGPGLQGLLRPAVSPCVAGRAKGTERLGVVARATHHTQEPVRWSRNENTTRMRGSGEAAPPGTTQDTVTHHGRPGGSHPAPRSPPPHAPRSSRRPRYRSASCPRPAKPAGVGGAGCRGGARHPHQCSPALVHKEDHRTSKETSISMREKKEKTENTTQKIQIIPRT